MPNVHRRQFLNAARILGTAAVATPACLAISPLDREVSRIKGLSLSAYSLRPKMHWMKGKQTDGSLSMLDFLEYSARQGFSAAELTAYFFESPLRPATLRKIKRRSHLLGLDISGGAIGNDFSQAPDSQYSQQQRAETKSWIDHYADLGAPTIRIFAGRSRDPSVADAQVIKNAIANLEQVLPHAEQRGVMLGIENHDFAIHVDRLLEIVRNIKSDWLGITLDSGNLAPTADPYAELAKIAPYAVTAQIKTSIPVNGQLEPADFGRLIQVLQDARYAGYLVLEYEDERDAYQGIPEFQQRVWSAVLAAQATAVTSNTQP